jgi:uncharacterized protein HemX
VSLARQQGRVQDGEVTERQEATAMLKTSMLLLATVFGLGFGVLATAQTLQSASHATSTAARQPANQQANQQQHQVIKPGDRDCIRDTGSLIPAKRGQCLQGAFGRSYSAKELRDTGQPKMGEALRMLDPAIH